MKKDQKSYNINELCYNVIHEIRYYLVKCGSSDKSKDRNKVIQKWIDKDYPDFFRAYIKDHPLK